MKKIKQKNTIALFEQKEVRRVWHDEQWFFSVTDVVVALTDSSDVKQYIKKMRARDNELSVNWGTFCTHLEIVLRVFFVLFNLFRHPKRSHSNFGLRKSDKSE